MEKPDNQEDTLIVYGSLAPNAPNHHIIEHIKGKYFCKISLGYTPQYRH